MPVTRNANIHKYGSSKRRGLEVPQSNNVSQTLFHVSRRSKQQSSHDGDDCASSATDKLGRSVCELNRWGAGGRAGRDRDCGCRRSSTSRHGWDDGAVITTAARGESIAGRGASAQVDAGGRVVALVLAAGRNLGEVRASNASLVGQVNNDGEVAKVGDAVRAGRRVEIDVSNCLLAFHLCRLE